MQLERIHGRHGERTGWLLAALCGLAALCSGPSAARAGGVPGDALVYGGTLEENGKLVTGTFQIALTVFDAAEGGNERCNAPDAPTSVDDGRFSIELPARCADVVHDAADLWIEVTVDRKALAPRAKIAALPYALESGRTSDATGALRTELNNMAAEVAKKLTVANGELVITSQGNVGVGTSTPDLKLQVGGDVRVGDNVPAGQVGNAGWGSALVLSGGPNLDPGWNSDNSDPVWLARYNTLFNTTELRAVVGDDPNQPDEKFVVGAMQGDGNFDKNANWFPVFSVGMDGNVRAIGTFTANSAPDIAETIPTDDAVRSADVVCADLARRERAVRCTKGDTAVLGVIAGPQSSFLINAHGGAIDGAPTGKPLVLAGRVPVRVTLENGAIRTGDFLAPSSVPGAAMKATGPGPVVGIALSSWDGHGDASVLCFVQPGAGGLSQLAADNARLREKSAAIEADNRAIRAENAAIQARLARLEKTVSALPKK